MPTSVWEVSHDWWSRVKLKMKRAVVFVDAGMAEMLHWSGGMALLLQAGALDIRDFSSFESGKEGQQKAVFLVSSALTGVTESIVRDIVTGSSFQYVVLFTTVSPLLHPADAGGGDDWEGVWEDRLLHWMGNMNYTAEAGHMPAFGVEVCPHFFITPVFSRMYPLLPCDVKQVAYQYKNGSHPSHEADPMEQLSDLEVSYLPQRLQAEIRELSSGLHALLQGLDVKEDIYSMGHTARLVATELDAYPPGRARRKATQSRASLVLLDRTLDLTPVLSHQADTLFDQLANTLKPLPGHCSDRLVDMSALTYINKDSPSVAVLPGGLAPTKGGCKPTHLTPAVFKKQKEAVMEINRKLVETAAAEKLPLKLGGSRPGRVSADLLDSTLALFKGKYSVIKKHLDLLQIAVATTQSLRNSRQTDAVTAAEKNLVQALADGMSGDGTVSAMGLLSRLAHREMKLSPKDREINLDDLLCLLSFTFSLSGGDFGDAEEANELRQKIVEWILQDNADLPPIFKQIIGDTVSETILRDQIDSLWERLEAIGSTREDLSQFSSILEPGDDISPAHARPLLVQVMESILDPARPELVDVECKSGGLGNLLKSGFGFFKGSGKPRPGDAPLLILFVIGGLTSGEVKQVKDMVDKAAPQFEVLLGSTRLPSITSTLESLFVQDNVNITCL
ncbi:hypothetical protein RRG08_035856 [Elysia crispata]|uniref:Sec1 family domain-containing protein 2 n=1 Tax=Elysia crispata TaxID=231223 RepID=A0AAE0Z5C3_9GAST|nr:hypothetical protein RRG08_035856 [Elysia crispata]